MIKIYSLSSINIYDTVSLSNIYISNDRLPYEDLAGNLIINKIKIATLKYGKKLFEGGYGSLYLCKRIQADRSKKVMVKKAKDVHANLTVEGILQWIARKTLELSGLETAIPEIFDIFVSGHTVAFSMELIQGDFPYIYLARIPNPDEFFFLILAQVSLVLYFLETNIFLDHRDLKANNLYIRETPISYNVTIEGLEYELTAPFQVLLLDFGFACIGDESGLTKINIAEGTFPHSDPCPKEGRDLFHLLTSFWSIPSIRDVMTPDTQKEIDEWLVKDKKDFSKLTRKTNKIDWVYVVTSDPDFSYPKLKPTNILKRLTEMKLSGLNIKEATP
jgi:hypothetical protein